MNSIANTQFAIAEHRTDGLYAALYRLSAWIDVEMEALGMVLVQSGQRLASLALEELAQLHLEPDAGFEGLRALLDGAQAVLEYVLESLLKISCRQGTVSAWGLPGRDAFDVHLRWSAARLTDIIATLRHSLDA